MHEHQSGYCEACRYELDDGDEFIVLECAHMEHLACLKAYERGLNPRCSACN